MLQIYLLLSIFLFFLVLQVYFNPHHTRIINILDFGLTFAMYYVALTALLFNSDDFGTTTKLIFEYILLAVLGISVLLSLGIGTSDQC